MNANNPLPVPLAFDHIACPFCGLLCDDLRVSSAGQVLEQGCVRSRTLFVQSMDVSAQCLLGGEPTTRTLAVQRTVELLRHSRQPVVLCAGADVASLRALLDLADRCGAVVDHVNSEALIRNIMVLQDSGWITTTLTEIRNRADFMLCVGTDVVSRFPRFFERCALGGGLLDEGRVPPEILFLGAKPPAGIMARHIDVPAERLCELFSALRSFLGKQPVQAKQIAGVPLAEISDLLLRLQNSRYAVVVWAAADLTFPHAELTIQSLCELIKELNRSGRAAGLPLGGNDGDITAQQVVTWQSGFPLRTRFGRDGPEHDPYRYSAKRLLDSGEADALLFLSEMDTQRLPPAALVPTIVLGRAGMTPPPCEVFIPVGAPGLDRAGHLFRTDNVVAIPLRKLIDRKLPSAPDVLREIIHQLDGLPT